MKTKSHPAARTPDRSVPVKWRWHHRALQKLRDHLVDDLSLRLAAAAEPLEPHSMDPADSASDESDRALAVTLLSREHDALHEVNSALRRIGEGTYGICERTGKRIPALRLRAVPWTRFTKEAEEALEKDGWNRGAKLAPATSIQGGESDPLAEAEDPGKEELQARVIGRHQLAARLAALGQGGRGEPAPETKPDGNGHNIAAPIRREPSRRPAPHAQGGKRARGPARRAGRRNPSR